MSFKLSENWEIYRKYGMEWPHIYMISHCCPSHQPEASFVYQVSAKLFDEIVISCKFCGTQFPRTGLATLRLLEM